MNPFGIVPAQNAGGNPLAKGSWMYKKLPVHVKKACLSVCLFTFICHLSRIACIWVTHSLTCSLLSVLTGIGSKTMKGLSLTPATDPLIRNVRHWKWCILHAKRIFCHSPTVFPGSSRFPPLDINTSKSFEAWQLNIKQLWYSVCNRFKQKFSVFCTVNLLMMLTSVIEHSSLLL